ncbi:MAG: hypothetical protein JWR83_1898 [Aeromicrobium sp.]|jgi:ribosome-associated toxin RatA of RatAB toxin-antitoxin module|nr:hypothetical protein [Aeromicrobium sp.]
MSEPIQRTLSIDATPDAVISVLTDFADYPNWQKEIVATEITERDDQDRPVRVIMSTAAMGMTSRAELAVNYHDDGVEWHLVQGDMMTQNDTRWTVRPNSLGGTDAELQMELAIKWNLPPFMMKQIITKGVNDNLKAVKKVAEGA